MCAHTVAAVNIDHPRDENQHDWKKYWQQLLNGGGIMNNADTTKQTCCPVTMLQQEIIRIVFHEVFRSTTSNQ